MYIDDLVFAKLIRNLTPSLTRRTIEDICKNLDDDKFGAWLRASLLRWHWTTIEGERTTLQDDIAQLHPRPDLAQVLEDRAGSWEPSTRYFRKEPRP